MIPSFFVIVFYLRIFIYVRSIQSANATTNAREMKKSIRLAKGLFGAFTFFILCWVPYGIVVMSDYKDQLPTAVHMFAIELAHFNSALNPVFYAVFSSGFKKAYRLFLSKLFTRRVRFQVNVTQASTTTRKKDTQTRLAASLRY